MRCSHCELELDDSRSWEPMIHVGSLDGEITHQATCADCIALAVEIWNEEFVYDRGIL